MNARALSLRSASRAQKSVSTNFAVRLAPIAPMTSRRVTTRAVDDDNGESSSSPSDLEAARSLLQRSFDGSSGASELSIITGKELRQLIFDKWSRSFDCRLAKRNGNMYLHIMWRFLEQKSFPLTEEEYEEQLSAVCEYLSFWGVAERVRSEIKACKQTPGYTVGGGARAVSIRLDVDVDGLRSGEWN